MKFFHSSGPKVLRLSGMRGQEESFKSMSVSPRAYGHGIGAGDVNKDGRNDIVTPLGWLEAPPDPRRSEWRFHEDFKLGEHLIYFVIDLNEDGLPDLLTGMAHGYGIFWMEQRPGDAGEARD